MKLSMLDRHLKSLESYLGSGLNQRFYSADFLSGIAHQRNEILERQGRAIGSVFVLTGLLLISESATASVSIAGVSLQIGTSLRAPLTLLLSFSVFTTVLCTLDQIIIERYISTIGARANLWSFQIVIANLTARNLWVDPLIPKFFGLKSGRGHKLAFGLVGINMLLLMGLLLFLPASTVIAAAYKILTQSSAILELIVASGSLFVLAISVLFLAFFVLARFEFDKADFDEVSGQPTQEFLKKLEQEQKAKEHPTTS